MNGALIIGAAAWLAAGFSCAALATGVAAALARTLFAACLYVCVSGMCAGVAVLALGAGDASLALAIVFGGWAPMVLLAGVLLSGRATKSRRGASPWISISAAAVAAGAVVWAAHGEIGRPAAGAFDHADASASGIWLAAIALMAGAGCLAMLGYGERGALQRKSTGGGA